MKVMKIKAKRLLTKKSSKIFIQELWLYLGQRKISYTLNSERKCKM